jgi:hypothetical protein
VLESPTEELGGTIKAYPIFFLQCTKLDSSYLNENFARLIKIILLPNNVISTL